MTEVFAFDPKRTTNAQAIADCVTLGYLRPTDEVLDATYGKGRFWKLWKPVKFWGNDLDLKADCFYHVDYRDMRFDDATFDAVVFDPDYKLTGNSKDHQTGSGTLNADYGLDRDYKPVNQLQAEHDAGFIECLRVTRPRGYVLYKTMAQVVSGAKAWLDMEMWLLARGRGCRLVDQLYVVGARKQPAGTRQVHSRGNVSVLQIYMKAK